MLKLCLPILFPSWRFFSSIGPSPRIDIGFTTTENAEPHEWLPFRPQPESVSFSVGLQRLFYNPLWNELLYINSCAEHLFENYSAVRELEIGQRLVAAVLRREVSSIDQAQSLIFRIRAIQFDEGQVRDEVVFISRAFVLSDAGVSK